MATLRVILFYGGDNATGPREQLLNWLRTPRVADILGNTIDARKVSDWPASSGHSVFNRVQEAMDWADIAITLITSDQRSESGAPNAIDEIARWQERKGGDTLAVIRQKGVKAHSNIAGLVYIEYQNDVVAECGEKLLQFLQQANPPLPPIPKFLSNIPPRPPLVVGRENDIANLKSRIGVGKIEKLPLTIVRGWPGVGKTTTVLTLIHQPGIAEAFPDGVLWAALGENPNVFSELAAWGRALGVDDIGGLPTIKEAMNRLAAILRNKQMLLVVDDIWEVEHGVPFKIAGEKCATVFTTRFKDVASALADVSDEQIYLLPVLIDEKALELLEALTPKTVKEYPDKSLVLVQDLEGLPLAIQVAGRLLNEEHGLGWSVAELITELREGAKLLAATAPADRADIVNQTTPTVAALLKKSTDTLSEETQIHFAFLGVFAPKPATFDLAAMTAVWLADDPKPSVRILVNRGLLEPVGERYQMHALLVAHAKSILIDD